MGDRRSIESFKPKMNATDYIFAGIGFIYLLVVGVLVAGTLSFFVCGCNGQDEVEIPRPEYEAAEDGDLLAPPERVLKSIALYGPYQEDSYLEGGTLADTTQCLWLGKAMVVYLEDLNTPVPRMVGEYDIYCDPVDDTYTMWGIHCEEYVGCEGCFPWYYIYYDFYVDKLRWDEKEYLGYAYWTIDIDEYFWCVMPFRITDAEPEFTWR